jgi:drug/metabolite transporter (DMT)-like permease
MNAQQIAGVALIVGGVLALAYGGFSYTRQTHDVDLGPIHIGVEERQRVNVPIWAGGAAIVIGGVLLVMRRRA